MSFGGICSYVPYFIPDIIYDSSLFFFNYFARGWSILLVFLKNQALALSVFFIVCLFLNSLISTYFLYFLLSLSVICPSFHNFLRWILWSLIFSHFSFLIHAFKAVHFLLSTTLAVSHKLDMLHFYYSVKIVSVSTVISSVTNEWYRSILFQVQTFRNFLGIFLLLILA